VVPAQLATAGASRRRGASIRPYLQASAVAAGGSDSQALKRHGGLTGVGRQLLEGKRGAVHPNGGMRQPRRMQVQYRLEHQLIPFRTSPATQRIGDPSGRAPLGGGHGTKRVAARREEHQQGQ
jgi:hypothetical protein